MVKTMLVVVDGSARDGMVLELAGDLARKFASKMRLIRVLETGRNQAELHAATEELFAFSARVMGVTFEPPVVVSGTPAWREILDAASRLNVDLVVVGGLHGPGVASFGDRHVFVVRERGDT